MQTSKPIDWNRRFKEASQRAFGNEVVEKKWWHVQHWGIGEWGSLASMAGVFFWGVDKMISASCEKRRKRRRK